MQQNDDRPLDMREHILKLRKRFRDLEPIRICAQCKTPVADPSQRYCMSCGAPIHQSGRMTNMLYKAIRLSENGKAVVCPHCDNEELTSGEFCMICGCNIVNRCADTPGRDLPDSVNRSCRTALPGNARYCPKCGNESTFYQKGWLRDWRSENTKRAIENIHKSAVDITELPKKRGEASGS